MSDKSLADKLEELRAAVGETYSVFDATKEWYEFAAFCANHAAEIVAALREGETLVTYNGRLVIHNGLTLAGRGAPEEKP